MAMQRFSTTIDSFWQTQFPLERDIYRENRNVIVVSASLRADLRLMILQTSDGSVKVTLAPEIADMLDLGRLRDFSTEKFQRLLGEANISLHGADNLFYFTETEKKLLLEEQQPNEVRRLSEQDEALFSKFVASASQKDLDDAYVELDHWAVFGSFEDHQLASVASIYPWEKSSLADIGVLTLQPLRGKRHARNVVRAICRHAYHQGFEPQYRCQVDNQASINLARSAGMTLFGTWDVATADPERSS